MFWDKKPEVINKPVDEKDEKQEEVKALNARIRELTREKQKLNESIEEMKFKKRLEQEEIVHIQKLAQERMKQELENEKASINKKYLEDIGVFKEQQRKELVESLTKFHNKMESRFSEELKNLKEVYGLLMEKLPNVNFAISKHIGGPAVGAEAPSVIDASAKTRHKG